MDDGPRLGHRRMRERSDDVESGDAATGGAASGRAIASERSTLLEAVARWRTTDGAGHLLTDRSDADWE